MPQLTPWTLVATDAQIARLSGHTLVLAARDEEELHVTVVTIMLGRQARGLLSNTTRCRLTHAPLGAPGRPRSLRVPAWLRLDDLVRERLSGGTLEQALVVPGVRWGTSHLFRDGDSTAVTRGEGGTSYDASQILARLDTAAAPAEAEHSPEAAHARVARVKEALGELTTDVLYRIERSALFDSSVPLTRQFQLLLMRWDDEAPKLGAVALDRLSFEIELAFDTARDHAETVGLAHLPSTARPAARRALKGARLARRATSDGERAAALTQVQRLLASLALYYLPAPEDVPTMIGGSAPKLGQG